MTLLRSRAVPNERLLRAFGIHNSTFTSSSEEVHSVFTKQVLGCLRNLDSPHRWKEFKALIHSAVDFYLPDGSVPGDYAAYMQAIVFTTILAVLFDFGPPFPDAVNVREVTEGINTLWLHSKTSSSHPSKLTPTLSRINQHLQSWIPANPMNPFRNNPLEILLPAYETMWRLCAHTYVYVEGIPENTSTFIDFFDNPTSTQFRLSRDLKTPSAHNVIQEVLRLHPPTKRIKRSSDVLGLNWAQRMFAAAGLRPIVFASNIVAADIEALQRSPVWDPLPHDFDAMRHQTSTEVQKQCFMPFGLGPLRCVASAWAPRMAGMLVAGLAKRADVQLIRAGSPGGRDGWEGWKIGRKE